MTTKEEEQRRTKNNGKKMPKVTSTIDRTTLQPSSRVCTSCVRGSLCCCCCQTSGTMSVTKHACISSLNVLGPRANWVCINDPVMGGKVRFPKIFTTTDSNAGI